MKQVGVLPCSNIVTNVTAVVIAVNHGLSIH